MSWVGRASLVPVLLFVVALVVGFPLSAGIHGPNGVPAHPAGHAVEPPRASSLGAGAPRPSDAHSIPGAPSGSEPQSTLGASPVTAFPPKPLTSPYPPGTDPMGIADYGQAASSGVSYNSSSFEGAATIQNLSVCASSSTCGSRVLTLQLNLNLGFEDGGNWYVYWIQDIAWLNTASRELTAFENNIWNLSSSGSSMYASTVSGSGAIYSPGYYAYGISTPWGYWATYPASFQLIANASVSSHGQPVVQFMFDLGGGFSTFDQVTFSFVSQLDYSDAFIVNYSSVNPSGLGYDSEFVFGGPGNGSSTIDESSDVRLGLQYWNGDNYETVNNAENHGEDTAETITNTDVVGEYWPANGSLYAQMSAGTENIDPLWFSSQISLVKVVGPGTCDSILSVSGIDVPYLDGSATIMIGTASVDFQVSCDGYAQDLGSYTLSPGSTTILSTGTWADVNFGQSGLPSSTPWTASVESDQKSTSGTLLSFYVPTGSYAWRLSGGAGYFPDPSAGVVSVGSAGIGVSIVWEAVVLQSTAESGTIDIGQSLTFSVSLANGSVGDSFSWTGLPAGCSSANSSTIACAPTAQANYSVEARLTDANGFLATSAAFALEVFSDPSVAFSAATPGSSDAGQTIVFSSMGNPGSGHDRFSWFGLPSGCSDTGLPSITCAPTDVGPYSLSVSITDSDNFTSNSSVHLFTIYSQVSVTLTISAASVLQSKSVTLTAVVSGGSGEPVYVWSGLPAGCAAPTGASLTCSPSVSGRFNVTVTVTDRDGGRAARASA